MAAKVAIRQCEDYQDDLVQKAVAEAAGAVCDPVALLRDRKVLIKINLLMNVGPERGVCTHPALTRAIIRLCKDAGAAKIIVGDMPGMNLTDKPEEAFEASGNAAVCREEGTKIAPFSRKGYREVKVKNHRQLPVLNVAKDLLDAEVVINAPKLKFHIQALYTGAIKNWFGTITNADRRRSHRLSQLQPFSESLVDIFSTRLPELTVMDAIVGMEGRGPSEGKLKNLGLVLASTDAVALDAVALECVDWSAQNVPHVYVAGRDGLGEADFSKISVDGPAISDVRKHFERPPRSSLNPPKWLVKIIFRLYYMRPKIIVADCQTCGACEKMCPVGAIHMTENFAVINSKKCIECFCCHEACPHGAVGEDMSLVYRMHRRYEKWRENRR